MKAKTIYLLVAFLMCSSILYSQTDNQVEVRIANYKTKLNLTENQCEQLRVILLNDGKEAQNERELNKDNPDALIASAKARKERTDTQIKNILTNEQWEKYTNIEKQDLSDRQLLELKERLLLTDEQVEKIQPVMANTREKISELNQKNYHPRKQMQEMKKIMDGQAKEIEKYLTKEQEKKFKNLRKEHQEKMKRNKPRPGQYRN